MTKGMYYEIPDVTTLITQHKEIYEEERYVKESDKMYSKNNLS